MLGEPQESDDQVRAYGTALPVIAGRGRRAARRFPSALTQAPHVIARQFTHAAAAEQRQAARDLVAEDS